MKNLVSKANGNQFLLPHKLIHAIKIINLSIIINYVNTCTHLLFSDLADFCTDNALLELFIVMNN